MQISYIGTSFAGSWGLQKAQQKQVEPVKLAQSTQYFHEVQKTVGSWTISIITRNSSKARNVTINNRNSTEGECYGIHGYALEHNSNVEDTRFAHGCYLDKEEKELVDSYIELFRTDYVKEEDVNRLVSSVLKPALKRHGKALLY